MSGICETCKREPCSMRFDGCKICDVYEGGETRYERLFGTPERAARTLLNMCKCAEFCDYCPLYGQGVEHCEFPDAKGSVLEWLRGDAE